MKSVDEKDVEPAEAAGAVQAEQKWLPTAENVNALPEGVRRFVHDLATRCDPAGDVAALTGLRDQIDGVQVMYRKAADALEEVRGCFHAAEVEGLSTALTETTDEHLKDLVERRLMHALYAAQEVATHPAEPMGGALVASEWKCLNDVQWMNIVNHDRAYHSFTKDEAVHEAVKRTEAKLRELNSFVPTGAQVAKAEQQDQPQFTEEEICKIRAAKRGMVDALIRSNMNYGKCGVVSHRLEKLIEALAAPTESAAAPADLSKLRESLKEVADVLEAFGDLPDELMSDEKWHEHQAWQKLSRARELLEPLATSTGETQQPTSQAEGK